MEFGILAKSNHFKVTNVVKRFDNLVIIPCSMSFKDNKGNWVNEWCDVKVSGPDMRLANGIEKGDKISVSGKMSLTEYNGKKSWQCWATEIEKYAAPEPQF